MFSSLAHLSVSLLTPKSFPKIVKDANRRVETFFQALKEPQGRLMQPSSPSKSPLRVSHRSTRLLHGFDYIVVESLTLRIAENSFSPRRVFNAKLPAKDGSGCWARLPARGPPER